MALQKQMVGVPIKGLNTKADPKNANVGECDLIENMFFHRGSRGGAELKKRYGGVALAKTCNLFGASSPITKGVKLAAIRDERLMIGQTSGADDPVSLYQYLASLSKWKRTTAQQADLGNGGTATIGVTSKALQANAFSAASPDIAISPDGTLMVACWLDQVGSVVATYFMVIDMATGETLAPPLFLGTAISSAGWVRVVALATGFLILFTTSTAGRVDAGIISYASPNLYPTMASLLTDLNATCKADIIKNGSNDSALLAYHTTVPNTKILIVTNAAAAGTSTTNAEIPSQAIGWVNWDFSDANGYLAFVSAATGAKVFTVAQAGPAISATTVMDAGVTAAANVTGYKTTSTARFYVYIEVRGSQTYNCLIRRWIGSGVTAPVYLRSVGLAGACFKVATSGRYYLPTTYDSTLQSAYYLFDVSFGNTSDTGTIVSRNLYGLGGGLTVSGSLGATAAASSSVSVWAVQKLFQNPQGTKLFAIATLTIDFAPASMSGAARLGEGLYLPGAALRMYDGTFCPEAGFHVFPEQPTLAQGAGGSLTVLGSYQYAVVYAWADGRGQWHRSAPSPIASITLTGANATVTLTIPTLRLTARGASNMGDVSQVIDEVYRTVAGGTTFFRISATVVNTINQVIQDTISVTDTFSDAAISANEILYTVGKILPHIEPPGARLLATWRDRLFLAGTENPNELWVSNEFTPGNGGPSFSDALVLQVEADGDAITAIAEMDDRLVIFKRNSIYVLTGSGPTLTGDNQFQAPSRITSAVGAKQQPGVVKMRDGLMFVSTRGIYLLGHSGQILYVGSAVDAFNSLTITGASVLEDEEQVRFVTAEGRTLVYHYGVTDDNGMGFWTTFTNQPAVDCAYWNGRFVFLKSDGTVVEESIGAYTDPSATSITAKARLCWLSLTQFFGRFKLYGINLLGDMLASFTLTHRLAYDFDPTVTETETKAVTVANIPPLALVPARRRASAVQVTLEETSTTQGFTVSGWGLEVGVEPGAAKGDGLGDFLT